MNTKSERYQKGLSKLREIAGDRGTVLPELTDLLPDAIRIKHATNNSWETPDFVRAVKQTGCKTLAMAGLAIDVGSDCVFPQFRQLRLGIRSMPI